VLASCLLLHVQPGEATDQDEDEDSSRNGLERQQHLDGVVTRWDVP
jgi:hypothetical protein